MLEPDVGDAGTMAGRVKPPRLARLPREGEESAMGIGWGAVMVERG